MMSAAAVPEMSPVRRKHTVLAASNKRKRSSHQHRQPDIHEQQRNTPLNLFVQGRSMASTAAATRSPEHIATRLSPPAAVASALFTSALDSQTDSLIHLLSSQHAAPPQAPKTHPSHSSNGTVSSRPQSPPRSRSPPSPTTVPPTTRSTTHPAPPVQPAQEPLHSAVSSPSPPPVLSLPSPTACPHTVTATSPSAPKSTIASYIHRFRTQPPLDERERHMRLHQHHELPQRDFWWLKRHSADDGDERADGVADGTAKEQSVDEATASVRRSMSGDRIRVSILPAIEAVLSEEERRVTAELARWSRMSTAPAEERRDASFPLQTAQGPASISVFNSASQQPAPAVAASLVAPVTQSFVTLPSTAASPAAILPPLQPSQAVQPQSVLNSPFLVSSVALTDAAPHSPSGSLTHRDNILRLARELRLPGLSSIAGRDLPATLPAPQASDPWTVAPLADSYSLIPRRAGQWAPLSPPQVSAASPRLSAASTASPFPSSQATSTLSSRATTEDDVDVDDILAQWRRNHRSAHALNMQPPVAAQITEHKQQTAEKAKHGSTVWGALGRQDRPEIAVEQLVEAVIKRLKEERKDDQTAEASQSEAEAQTNVESKQDVHVSTQPHGTVVSDSPFLPPAADPMPSSGSTWHHRKKSLSLQLPPRPHRVDHRRPQSPVINSTSSSVLVLGTATPATSLKPQQTHWVAPTRPAPADDSQVSVTAPASTSLSAGVAPPVPILSSPPRPVVTTSSLLTGALSAVVGRALTCPAPSFADHVHSAMSASALPRATSEAGGKQLRVEDLDDDLTSLLSNHTDEKHQAEERMADNEVIHPSIQLEQSTLASVACPPAIPATHSTSPPATFASVSSAPQLSRPVATTTSSALSKSAVTHTSVAPAPPSPPSASHSLSVAHPTVSDATQALSSLSSSMLLLPATSSSQTALQVQLVPTQPAPLPFFTLPASMASLYAMTTHATHSTPPTPVFIPIMVSAAQCSSSTAVAQPPPPPRSAPDPPSSSESPHTAPQHSPPTLTASVAASHSVPAPLDLEAELAELLSSLHVSVSIFADEPRLHSVVSRMQQLQMESVSVIAQ